MQRKVIQLARKTLVVSLPAKWARQYGIRKGDEVEVEQDGHSLRVKTARQSTTHAVGIDLSGMSSTSARQCILAAYRAGADQLDIVWSHPVMEDSNTGLNLSVRELVCGMADSLLGFAVVSQGRNSCTLAEVSAPKAEEFGRVLSQLFHSVSSTAQDIASAARAHDTEALADIGSRADRHINQLSDFCMRCLHRTNPDLATYHIVAMLESLGDYWTRLARTLAQTPQKVAGLHEAALLMPWLWSVYQNPSKENLRASCHERRKCRNITTNSVLHDILALVGEMATASIIARQRSTASTPMHQS
ncbi:AbrB/MazE/SpoVT family DNA-binding domain-containing protein [Candidatus Woesearchaeota archaeon]|nr:AbrB/MazE/SpoVT family DNA-binding domain-containing protein [Candidatus Woesearchaeota archaeon]